MRAHEDRVRINLLGARMRLLGMTCWLAALNVVRIGAIGHSSGGPTSCFATSQRLRRRVREAAGRRGRAARRTAACIHD